MKLKDAKAILRDGFDPGGNLPSDCDEWAGPYQDAVRVVLAALERLEHERKRVKARAGR